MADMAVLKLRATELDLPLNSGVYKPKTEAWNELAVTAADLHRRIREEERHRRENRLWIVAVISAVASAISAATALAALLLK